MPAGNLMACKALRQRPWNLLCLWLCIYSKFAVLIHFYALNNKQLICCDKNAKVQDEPTGIETVDCGSQSGYSE